MVGLNGVLLDIDGTLVDSNDSQTHAWIDALMQAGYRVGFEKIRPHIGMGADKLLPLVAGLEYNSLEGKRIARRRAEIFRTRYLPCLETMPGARELIMEMHDSGLKLIAVSSGDEEEVRAMLGLLRVHRFIDGWVTPADAPHSSPPPGLLLAGLNKAGLCQHEAVLIGDTPYDVQAAKHAGIDCIGFRSGGGQDRPLEGTVATYDGPADMLVHFDHSPLFTEYLTRAA